MKKLRALLWKEWREDHIYLWIGLGVLLILPIINAWQETNYFKHFELRASEWIYLLGGIFAVVVSVGVSCRDLSEPLEDFWRSRPVAVGRWMLTKYAAGLAIVLACCIVPAVVELLLSKKTDAASYIIWYPFLWLAIFSVGFLIGCLLRKSAQTSLIAIGAMLLLYFLPIVLPPLHWLNVAVIPHRSEDHFGERAAFEELHPWAYVWAKPPLYFAVGMLALAVFCTLLALVVVKRDWRISVGRKTIFGSVAAAFLLLLTTAAFQLGTNMPVLQTVTVAEGAWVNNFYAFDDKANFMSGQTYKPDPSWGPESRIFNMYQDVTATPQCLQLSAPYAMDAHYAMAESLASPVQPNIRYLVEPDPNRQKYMLHVVDTNNGTEGLVPLRDITMDKDGREKSWYERPQIFHGQIYVPGDQLVTIDISEPQAPKIVSKTPYSNVRWSKGGGGVLAVAVPPVPGLSDQEQLTLAGMYTDGGLYVHVADGPSGDHLLLYRLQSLTHNEARFALIAERAPTPLEAFLRTAHFTKWFLKAGKVYVTQQSGAGINESITVFSTTGPHPLTPIGHFGAPSIIGMCPLSDGRCIVAGRDPDHWPAAKLWLLGPPPEHRQ